MCSMKAAALYRRVAKYLSLRNVTLSLAVGIVLYNELLCYWIFALSWATLARSSNENSLRILLVADPQLIGYRDESGRLNPIARWDCDRYLSKTFSHAVNYVHPHVVVFMGDLMDLGSTAQDDEYEDYFNRFKNIFKYPALQIHIPGDNDVGGEGWDNKNEFKLSRFREHFTPTQTNIVSVKFLDFYRLNLDNRDSAELDVLKAFTNSSMSGFRVVVNHMGLIRRHDIAVILQTLKPNIMFTAHDHKAQIATCVDCRDAKRDTDERWRQSWNGNTIDVKDSAVYGFELSSKSTITEIRVPTCSYRMGVPQMGYGYAVIDNTGHMDYTVLWLPPRYKCLYNYLYVIYTIIALWLLNCLRLVLCRKNNCKDCFSFTTI